MPNERDFVRPLRATGELQASYELAAICTIIEGVVGRLFTRAYIESDIKEDDSKEKKEHKSALKTAKSYACTIGVAAVTWFAMQSCWTSSLKRGFVGAAWGGFFSACGAIGTDAAHLTWAFFKDDPKGGSKGGDSKKDNSEPKNGS